MFKPVFLFVKNIEQIYGMCWDYLPYEYYLLNIDMTSLATMASGQSSRVVNCWSRANK